MLKPWMYMTLSGAHAAFGILIALTADHWFDYVLALVWFGLAGVYWYLTKSTKRHKARIAELDRLMKEIEGRNNGKHN